MYYETTMRQNVKSLLLSLILLGLNIPVTHAGSSEIRSQVSAVRIIIINDDDKIIQIYQNTPKNINPIVRRGNNQGPEVPYTPYIAEQDQAYRQDLPSLIEKLYAML